MTAADAARRTNGGDTMKARMIAVPLTALALLVGCGDDDGAATTITMTDNAFAPAAITMAPGDVELVNEGEATHNFTVEGEGVDVDVDAGATGSASIDLAAGTYTVFCEFHRSQGMEGTLTVEG
jgi:plastocyanin